MVGGPVGTFSLGCQDPAGYDSILCNKWKLCFRKKGDSGIFSQGRSCRKTIQEPCLQDIV
jgi:hypothetical protein